jgi:hypothetical protein
MSGRRLLRYFLLVGLAYGVATVGAGLTDYLTRVELSTTTNLGISGGVGLLTALCLGAIDLAKPGPAPPQPAPAYPPHPPPYPAAPVRPRSRVRVGVAFASVVLLAICAGGGFLVTTGVQWASHKLSDIATPSWLRKTQDSGVERLAAQATAQNGSLTLTVLSVRVNAEVTMVDATAINRDTDAVRMPVFENAQLTLPGATLKADPAASTTWSETIPPSGKSTGTIVFDGVLPADATEVTLSFSRIYSLSLNGPRNISVRIQLN